MCDRRPFSLCALRPGRNTKANNEKIQIQGQTNMNTILVELDIDVYLWVLYQHKRNFSANGWLKQNIHENIWFWMIPISRSYFNSEHKVVWWLMKLNDLKISHRGNTQGMQGTLRAFVDMFIPQLLQVFWPRIAGWRNKRLTLGLNFLYKY